MYGHSVANYPDEAALRATIATHPENVSARHRLAELMLDQGRWDEGLSEAQVGLRMFPDHGGLLGVAVMAAELTGADALAVRYSRVLRVVAEGLSEADRDMATATGGPVRWGRRRSDHIGDPELIDLTDPPAFDVPGDQKAGQERSKWPLARRVKPSRGPNGASRPLVVTSPTVTLGDVAGMTDLKWRLQGLLSGTGTGLGASPGALLLFGPRGCAKSYLAEAIAGQLGARMIRLNMNDVVEAGDQDGAELLRMAFTLARQATPCVLVLDEIDALADPSKLHARRVDVLAMRLAMKLDECLGAKGITIVATSSAPWRIDAALRAAGRFERGLFVPPPDLLARARILADRLGFLPLSPDVNPGELANDTEGMSASELLHVCAAAAEHALCISRHAGTMWPVTQRDLRRAIEGVDASSRDWFLHAHRELRNGSSEVDTVFDYVRRHVRRF